MTCDEKEKELAQKALDVQNACNVSGIVHTLTDVIDELWAIERERHIESTDRINNHIVVRAFIAKLADLAGFDYSTELGFWDKLSKLAGR